MGERLRFLDLIGLSGIALGLWRGEQVACARDVVGAGGVGEQTVVADAVEAAGQNVAEEPADELMGRERP